jgi:hypothetical protein
MAPPISPLMAPLIGPLMAPSSGLRASLRALRLELWASTILTGREGSLQYLGVQRAVRGRGATKYRTGARALAVEPVALRMVLGRLGDVVHPVCSTTGLGFVKSVRNHRRIHNLRVPQPTPRAPWRSELQSRCQRFQSPGVGSRPRGRHARPAECRRVTPFDIAVGMHACGSRGDR